MSLREMAEHVHAPEDALQILARFIARAVQKSVACGNAQLDRPVRRGYPAERRMEDEGGTLRPGLFT